LNIFSQNLLKKVNLISQSQNYLILSVISFKILETPKIYYNFSNIVAQHHFNWYVVENI